MSESVRVSKYLSYVLRHRPDSIGLALDEQGWANVEELLARSAEHGETLDRATLDEIVRTCPKRRYAFSEDRTRIRASQGHSLKIDLALKPQTPPETLYHGTATRFLEVILRDGLRSMNRTHVHLSADVETATAVGRRHGKPVVLEVAAARMANDGYRFYLSENSVWLAEVVPPQYLRQVES
ncbi:MAG TPA: RNA 2'-phosphotransferase [Pirellulaceae bacterium]|jgi:putative RNA 2'-phosphotransferase|nr:RNA 2'-phosphotransferase [Pirellulaceae bacterium]